MGRCIKKGCSIFRTALFDSRGKKLILLAETMNKDLTWLRVRDMRPVLNIPFPSQVVSPDVNDRYSKISRYCVFPRRVEILFRDFGDQHIVHCWSGHCQHEWHWQRDKAKYQDIFVSI